MGFGIVVKWVGFEAWEYIGGFDREFEDYGFWSCEVSRGCGKRVDERSGNEVVQSPGDFVWSSILRRSRRCLVFGVYPG